MWNLVSVRLEIVLVSVQDRSMVCVEYSIGLEIILDSLHRTLGNTGHVEPHFVCLEIVLVSMQDRSMVCAKHTIGSEIILDASVGSPR
jgi:hypothetical protein